MLVARARNTNYEIFDLQKLYTSVEVSKKHDVCEEAQRFWTSRSPTLVNPFGCSLSYLWYCCSMEIYGRKMVQIVQIFSKKYIRKLLLLLPAAAHSNLVSIRKTNERIEDAFCFFKGSIEEKQQTCSDACWDFLVTEGKKLTGFLKEEIDEILA
jgi:hypothetical protein